MWMQQLGGVDVATRGYGSSQKSMNSEGPYL